MRQLKIISIVWGLTLFAIFSVLTFFALKWNAKTDGYIKLEQDMIKNTKTYYESFNKYPEKGEYTLVTAEEIKNKGIMEELKVNDDECEGYVKVEYKNVVEYEAFIKCKKYTTKNYDKYLK